MAARGANWTDEEISVLVDEVSARIDVIKGKFSPTLTNDMKNKAWGEIVAR